MIQPHVARKGTLGPGRGEAEARVIAADDDVAQQGKVGTAGKAATLDLGDDRLVHVEQGHAAALRCLEPPGIVIEGLAATPVLCACSCRRLVLSQVIAGRKVASVAAQHHAVHAAVVICRPQCALELLLHLHTDGVALLRPVERDAGPPAVDRVGDRLEYLGGVRGHLLYLSIDADAGGLDQLVETLGVVSQQAAQLLG